MKTTIKFSQLMIVIGSHLAMSQTTFASTLPVPFERLAKDCAPGIHVDTLKALVTIESSGNPYAIGVVDGVLERQPRSLPEAISTAKRLDKEGFNFSMGLSQVNRYNLPKYGETYESIFEPCRNLRTGAAILTDCFTRASLKLKDDQAALRAALSCYYSGNFSRGFRPDAPGQPSYVQKVVDASIKGQQPLIPKLDPNDPDAKALSVRRSEPSQPAKSINDSPTPWVIFSQKQDKGISGNQGSETGSDTVEVKIKQSNPKSSHEVPFVQFLE
ncbi:lytic transglycosylase domain-containing protein [Microcoleus sp. MON1_C5]